MGPNLAVVMAFDIKVTSFETKSSVPELMVKTLPILILSTKLNVGVDVIFDKYKNGKYCPPKAVMVELLVPLK